MGKILATVVMTIIVLIAFAAFGEIKPAPPARIADMHRLERAIVTGAGDALPDEASVDRECPAPCLPDRMEVGSIAHERPHERPAT